jgi:hypothetical protein
MPEMPRPKRQPKEPVPRTARRRPEPPSSTRAHDTPAFVERVDREPQGESLEKLTQARRRGGEIPPMAARNNSGRGDESRSYTPEFRRRMDAAAREKLGAPIEEIVPPGDLRDMLYHVFEDGLRREPRPVSPEMMELVEHFRVLGLVVTPGAGPAYLAEPLELPISLTDALLEERYGRESDHLT